jgi:hypothetical protein
MARVQLAVTHSGFASLQRDAMRVARAPAPQTLTSFGVGNVPP